ncbi:helix-turn-helix domain-containing protein [Kineococcus sp. TBRC 1896]|uniref:Helix-turn-helix domain-containing protein n=1 Tax=Kineococcus mangrovi TaxID=1660183 RepID=A0ABV4HWI9_9ACTN
MPRQNAPRTAGVHDRLVAWMKAEREQRGWSYETLAQHMTAVGCPINQSAIYKIENGSPRRRIDAEEVAALAEVFDVSVGELFAGPETRLLAARSANRAAAGAIAEARRAVDEAYEANRGVLDQADSGAAVPEGNNWRNALASCLDHEQARPRLADATTTDHLEHLVQTWEALVQLMRPGAEQESADNRARRRERA